MPSANALSHWRRGDHRNGFLKETSKGCFEGIDHNWELAHIPMDKGVLRKWLKAGYVERHVLYPTDAGTPQGGIISPALANMTLNGLGRALREKFSPTERAKRSSKVSLVLYADDFIITGSTKELLADEVKPLVESFLQERGLELSQTKTRITHISDGFDFLGQNIRKYQGKLLIKPSTRSVQTLVAKVRAVVKGSLHLSAGSMVKRLNPIITSIRLLFFDCGVSGGNSVWQIGESGSLLSPQPPG